MYLSSIKINSFKNYEEENIIFSPNVNCLVGENGSGKTNLLDAIHYLALGKSSLPVTDSQCINFNSDYFRVEGLFISEMEELEISCAFRKSEKKILKKDHVAYERLSDHIGLIPLVLMAPYDTDLVRGISEVRRKFFDGVFSQTDRHYLDNLLQYNHFLKQRNALLKQSSEYNRPDHELIRLYNQKLSAHGQILFEKRKKYLVEFTSFFQKMYSELSGDKEIATIHYKSDLHLKELNQLLEEKYKVDLVLQRTSKGIHTDDFEFQIDDEQLIRKIGSQGQQKTFVIALKMAQYFFMEQVFKFKPILLLDDIFDKLDDFRMEQLIQKVSSEELGQVFISDARPERSALLMKNVKEGDVFKVPFR